jgi:uncharacterized damage-inducible protein DinB
MNYYQLMAAYNQWMNCRLYAVCAEIPDEERRRDLGAFFKSIHGTLNHLLFGDIAWMDRFAGRPRRYRIGDEICADFDALRAAREAMDESILGWVEALTEAWLEEPLEWISGIDGKTRRIPKRILVTHMFNHQTHHRGQLTTLIKQLGYDPGDTDIPWMPVFTPED